MKTVGIIGAGALSSIIAHNITAGKAGDYELIGICSKTTKSAERLAAEVNCEAFSGYRDIIKLKPDYMIEAAHGSVLLESAEEILRNGISLIPLSVGAFAEKTFFMTLQDAAKESGAHIYLPAGAVGGMDLLGAAAIEGLESVELRTEKPPKALMNAPVLQGRELSETECEILFSGNANEAIQHFPKNVNVSVATGLASIGTESVKVTVVSNPERKSNSHEITARGNFGEATVRVSANASNNAGSSKLAAYSVLNILKKLNATICFL